MIRTCCFLFVTISCANGEWVAVNICILILIKLTTEVNIMRFEFSDTLIFFSDLRSQAFDNNIFVFQSFLIGFDGFIFGSKGGV